MKNIVLILLMVISNGTFAQDEADYFHEDSLKLNEFPGESYFQKVSRGIGPDESWKGINKNGEIYFYDDDQVAFFGDTLPISIHSLREFADCRIGGGDYHTLKAHDGWYLGTNRGEWGGSLFRMSNNFDQCALICRPIVNQLVEYYGRVYLIEGLAHLSSSSGHILELQNDLTIDTLLTLEAETPKYIVFNSQNEGSLLTDSRIYRINSNMDTISLYSNSLWPYLYPSNLFYKDDILYATMYGGIAMYSIKTKKLHWLTRE
jgi:hypothetical protein